MANRGGRNVLRPYDYKRMPMGTEVLIDIFVFACCWEVTGNRVTFKLRIELNLFLKICMYKILYVYLRQK